MSFEFLDPALLIAAFAGGLFGAAVGGLPSFVLTGLAVLLGVASGLGGSEFNVLAAPDEPQGIAFGVVFGPHIAFAGGGPLAAVLAGAAAGIGGALLGELFSRLFLIHGDTHIDPPANAIWVMATLVFVGTLLFGKKATDERRRQPWLRART